MRRVGEVDALLAIGRDGDGADRDVEAACLQAAENPLHVAHRGDLEATLQLLRHPPPEVDSGADDLPVGRDVAVGRHVIDGDAEGNALERCRDERDRCRDQPCRQKKVKDETHAALPSMPPGAA